MYNAFLIIHAGFEVHPHGSQTSFHVKAYTICACFDLPARASALNVIQYNGQYGCNFCEQPGSSVRTEKGGHVLTFPYQRSSPKGPTRTHKTQVDYVRKAIEEKSVVKEYVYAHAHIVANTYWYTHHTSNTSCMESAYVGTYRYIF